MTFDDVNIRQINDDFLQPVQRTVNFIQITNAQMALDLDSIFGVHKFFNLERLHIDNQPEMWTLANSNFTGLRLIKTLMIINSGVEVIMPDAFDFIGVTLRSLRLSGNQLITLPLGLFNVMLENNKYPNNFDSVFMNNPWECDCKMLESLYVHSVFNSSKPVCHTVLGTCHSSAVDVAACTDMQSFTQQKLQLHSTQPIFAYAKFILNVIDGRAVVRSPKPRTYRLWMADHDGHGRWQIKNPKCPAYDWLTQFTRCVRAHTAEQHDGLMLMKASRHVFRTVCVNYIAFNGTLSFWPMHCVTYRLPAVVEQPEWAMWMVVAMIGCSLAGTVIGLVFSVLCRWLRSDDEDAKADAEADVNNKRISGGSRIATEEPSKKYSIDNDYEYVHCRRLPDCCVPEKVTREGVAVEQSIYCGMPVYDRNRYIVFNP